MLVILRKMQCSIFMLTVENLWTLKALLRGFEMTSGLKINFHKSCLIGVNVARDFMEIACDFLNCSEGALPFLQSGNGGY
jgi:hypothetical protein